MEKMILFLIRWKLGVKKYERFRFTNQKKPDIYYFTNEKLMKIIPVRSDKYLHKRSKVGINWLLDKECKVTKVQMKGGNSMSKFELGQLVMTKGVYEAIEKDHLFCNFVNESLVKYIECDWGDTCKEDAKQNNISVAQGERILAVYKYIGGKTIWIITEWDRSVTTILFPSEY